MFSGLQMENKVALDISSLCESILHLEALRTCTPDARNGDRNFVNLLNRYENVPSFFKVKPQINISWLM